MAKKNEDQVVPQNQEAAKDAPAAPAEETITGVDANVAAPSAPPSDDTARSIVINLPGAVHVAAATSAPPAESAANNPDPDPEPDPNRAPEPKLEPEAPRGNLIVEALRNLSRRMPSRRPKSTDHPAWQADYIEKRRAK